MKYKIKVMEEKALSCLKRERQQSEYAHQGSSLPELSGKSLARASSGVHGNPSELAWESPGNESTWTHPRQLPPVHARAHSSSLLEGVSGDVVRKGLSVGPENDKRLKVYLSLALLSPDSSSLSVL